jgi:acetolactate synthase I/II/III large subunit
VAAVLPRPPLQRDAPVVADFVKIADAHGLPGVHVSSRDEAMSAIRHARASAGPVLIDFHVQQEDAVYPMVSPGAALNEMIHAPRSALVETGADLL